MSKDKCISCDMQTEYEYETHIDLREFYIEGAGQLCKQCYEEVYVNRARIASIDEDSNAVQSGS